MARILVTPIPESGIEPFEVEGYITHDLASDCYYHDGSSYPAEIVTVLED